MSDSLIRDALDPRRSVVVEACAGSGKTWLLVSRILRVLLDGTPPKKILAITFTRKAAREIEERLSLWLRQLALSSDDEAGRFLLERGVPTDELDVMVPRARRLMETVAEAVPGMTVATFHGWFAQLVGGAPLDSDLTGFELDVSGQRLGDEVWQMLAQRVGQKDDAVQMSLRWLLQHKGLTITRGIARTFAMRCAEWCLFAGEDELAAQRALEALQQTLNVCEGETPQADLFASSFFVEELKEYASILSASSLKTELEAARKLQPAVIDGDLADRFAAAWNALFTQKGELRKMEGSKAFNARHGVRAERLLTLHRLLGERLLDAEKRCAELRAFAFNRHAMTLGAAFVEALDEYKRSHRLMSFDDLERQLLRLVGDEARLAFLQAKLDARYSQVLLDEFQDTNPMQWQILRAWLDAYDESDGALKLFLVGDPKQSIYRFRRAEARLFNAAAELLVHRFQAVRLANDKTRRNAPTVVALVNALFRDEPLFRPFRDHDSYQTTLPGRVEILPLCGEEAGTIKPDEADGPLRNPLLQVATDEEDGRRAAEANLLVKRLGEIVGKWSVLDKETGALRPLGFGDVMVLTRRRSVLPPIEQALREAGIPYLSVGRGGLLKTLEAADLRALLTVLVTPDNDLCLAHALRCPVFGVSDEDLLCLAERTEPTWWMRLLAWEEASQIVLRARQLLCQWQELARRLPVHDLLDRIYHEGEVFERYALAVPTAAWPGVQANLEAFIALALDIDAGRFPSLPRFLDELERLQQSADEEAPDEGVIRAAGSDDRVRLLTVHASKGLEAPLVWLVDAASTPKAQDGLTVLLDWPPDEDRPRHLSLLGAKEDRGSARDGLLEAERLAAEREGLNLLYVAVTRAQQYFFASGISAKGGADRPSAYARLSQAVTTCGGSEGCLGETPPEVSAHPQTPPLISQATSPTMTMTPVGSRRMKSTRGMMFGSAMHRLLEHGDKVKPSAEMTAEEWEHARQSAQRIRSAPELSRFFDPAHYLRAYNEVEFVLADGSIGRIDRLVAAHDAWWVLDYKSGQPDEVLFAEYSAQMERYRSAVSAVSNGVPVRCVLVMTDASWREL